MSILLYLANTANTFPVSMTVPVAYHMFSICSLLIFIFMHVCVCASVWVYTHMCRFVGGESFSIAVFPCAGICAVRCRVQPSA